MEQTSLRAMKLPRRDSAEVCMDYPIDSSQGRLYGKGTCDFSFLPLARLHNASPLCRPLLPLGQR